jgi:hypothetical protein
MLLNQISKIATQYAGKDLNICPSAHDLTARLRKDGVVHTSRAIQLARTYCGGAAESGRSGGSQRKTQRGDRVSFFPFR